ncbi:MAG TPA: tetratricopeptide repeat protein [Longimicrobiales bacterium]|nr:tetratricopeptide repeat protein [Longimicrobiales bacterium]
MAESHRDEIAKLEALYQSNPGGRSFTHLAEAYRKAGDAARALEVVQHGLTRHPDYASAYVVLGRVQQDLGSPDEAVAAFRRVLELDPENRVAIRALGDLARQGGRFDEALQHYRHLRMLDPSDEELEAATLAMEAELRQRGAGGGEAGVPEVAPFHGDYAPPPASEAAPVGGVDLPGDAGGWAQPSAPPVEPALPAGEELGRLLSLDELLPTSADGAPGEGEALGYELDIELAEFPAEGGDELSDLSAAPRLDAVDVAGAPEAEPPAATTDPGSAERPGVPESARPLPSALDEERGQAYDWELGAGTDAGEVVTETMAELYRAQGLPGRAAEIYRALLADHPDDERLGLRLLEVEAELDGVRLAMPDRDAAPADAAGAATEAAGPVDATQASAATTTWRPEPEPVRPVAVEEIESVWTGPSGARVDDPGLYAWSDEGDEEEGGRTIGEYFRAMLAWRAGDEAAERGSAPAVAEPPRSSAEPWDAEARSGGAVQEPAPADDVAGLYAPGDRDTVRRESDTPQPGPDARVEGRSPGEEDDLEMFRAWLQSLKR